MTRSAMHRAQYLALAGGILLVAADCPPRTVVSPVTLDTEPLLITTHAKPVPQKGDEKKARKPPSDSLGGPYSKADSGTITNAPTRGAPVVLTTAVNDSVLALYLDSLNFDGARDNGELAFVRCPPGGGAGCGALLYIQPEIGMKKRAYSDIPATGMVVARIINYSTTTTDSTYRIPPLTRAYWYVDTSPIGRRSRVFIRTPDSLQKLRFIGPTEPYSACPHLPMGGAATAKFRKCGPYETAQTRGDAVLYGIVPNPFIRPASFGPTLPSPALRALMTTVEPLTETELWVKCAQGCCVSGTA